MEQNIFTQIFTAWGFTSLYWLVWYILPGSAAAYYAYQDGKKRRPLALNIHPGWWALFCFVSGAWGLLAYWVMEHSTLRKGGGHEGM